MNTIIGSLGVIETTAFLSGMSCCICRIEMSDRKNVSYFLEAPRKLSQSGIPWQAT